jgi:hypothetical protein
VKAGQRAWSLWTVANGVLATASEPTPTVVWASGVYLLHHSVTLAAIWAGQHPLDGEYGGGGTIYVPGLVTRAYDIRDGRMLIKDYTGAGPMRVAVTIRTRAIEAQAAVDAVPAGLVDACRTLHVERRRLSSITMEHSDRRIRCDKPPGREEILAHGELWGNVERRCRDAAADVWECLRPRERPVQLDLFSVGGAR